MTNSARPLFLTAAAIAIALPFALSASAEETAPPAKSEHHGMAMDGHSGMMEHMQGDTKSGTAKEKSHSKPEGCQQMMDAMSKTAPDSGATAPKSERHGC